MWRIGGIILTGIKFNYAE